jgi:serine/threonine protein kinase
VRKDQVLRGYRVVTRPSNADAGKCLWAFAERDGREYFIKEFLDPKLPRPDSMGSVEDKRRRHAECVRFEERHRRVAGMLRADHLSAGNLVLTRAFFAEGTRYYKVTDRISALAVRPCDLELAQRVLVLRTLVESLRLLHECGIVHGDLKPENVLLHQPPGSDLHVAKLIDFDDSYPIGEPPERGEISGNPLYGAPEWLCYLRGDLSVRSGDIGAAVDMFAFGLLAHVYLCGELPAHAAEYESPATAVAAGVRLAVSDRVDARFRPVLKALVTGEAAARPSAAAVAELLSDLSGPVRPPRLSRVRSTFGRPANSRSEGIPQ